MKYSNLTYSEKILKWFEVNPRTINSICEDGYHILDWVYDGYSGKLSAKIDLTIRLLSKNANLHLIKIETYKRILETFLSNQVQYKDESIFVLDSIIKEKEKLAQSRQDANFFNPLILTDSFWDYPSCNIKNKILYSDIPISNFTQENQDQKINIYAHPICFLLEQYFFYLHEFRNYNTYTFLKIDKIHELNENILLSTMKLGCTEKILDSLEHFFIDPNENVVQILDKIKVNKELKVNNLNNPIVLPTIEAINRTIQRDLYRGLKKDLNINQIKETKHKL